MSYYDTAITFRGVKRRDDGVATVLCTTTHTDKTIQLYVSGKLRASAIPTNGAVQFTLPLLRDTDFLYFLAVDRANAGTDYFSAAFPTAAASGNRIKVQTPQLTQGFAPGDVWKVYIDAVLRHKQLFYPGGVNSGGFGYIFGQGFGFDGGGSGFGYNFGYGEFGFDCDMLEWISEPLPSAIYAVKVIVEDKYGNESTSATENVTIATFPRPVTDLAVSSYTSGTGTLVLTFTESEDT